MRGTVYESAIREALKKNPFVIDLWVCGMLGFKKLSWLACSPDGVVLMDVHALRMSDVEQPQLASIEIKTSIASSYLQ